MSETCAMRVREVRQPKRCNRCAALYINGIFCHETGCPNERKRWDAVEGEWFKVLECRECGCEVREGDECCQP